MSINEHPEHLLYDIVVDENGHAMKLEDKNRDYKIFSLLGTEIPTTYTVNGTDRTFDYTITHSKTVKRWFDLFSGWMLSAGFEDDKFYPVAVEPINKIDVLESGEKVVSSRACGTRASIVLSRYDHIFFLCDEILDKVALTSIQLENAGITDDSIYDPTNYNVEFIDTRYKKELDQKGLNINTYPYEQSKFTNKILKALGGGPDWTMLVRYMGMKNL